jgi:ubiquinone/menaquinone biosynthesis C-methylase UbiE
MISGTVYALDIDQEMLACTRARASAANLTNIELRCRDFVVDGSGLADGAVDYVMLFNILHAAEKLEMLKEAARVLSADGQLAVIHWNYDPTTPRGPSMSIRPRPSDCIGWVEAAGFRLHPDHPIDLPPYHYGLLFHKLLP